MKLSTFSLSILSSIILSTSLFADEPIGNICKSTTLLLQEKLKNNEYPRGVCGFDIDETLIKDRKEEGIEVFPETRQAIETCIKRGYAVALVTASWNYRDNVIKAIQQGHPDVFKPYDMGPCNYDGTMYLKADTAPSEKASNPIYTSANPDNGWTMKGQSMDRVMRTYYGVSAGHGFVDYSNPYLMKYRQDHKGELPDDRKLSKCMVLFDDNLDMISDVVGFNYMFGTQFKTVNNQPTGVTVNDVNTILDKMDEECPR